jgi:hydroxymethylbilane synthase
MIPAAGQGALALQCRREDVRTMEILASLNDPTAALCVAAERRIVAMLNGDCHSPIAILAEIGDSWFRVRSAVGARDGLPPLIKAAAEGPLADSEKIIGKLEDGLKSQNAAAILHG